MPKLLFPRIYGRDHDLIMHKIYSSNEVNGVYLNDVNVCYHIIEGSGTLKSRRLTLFTSIMFL